MLDAEQKQDGLLSDEELHDRMMSDPEAQGLIKEALAAAQNGHSTPGITAEQLPDFVRDHLRSTVDPEA